MCGAEGGSSRRWRARNGYGGGACERRRKGVGTVLEKEEEKSVFFSFSLNKCLC